MFFFDKNYDGSKVIIVVVVVFVVVVIVVVVIFCDSISLFVLFTPVSSPSSSRVFLLFFALITHPLTVAPTDSEMFPPTFTDLLVPTVAP